MNKKLNYILGASTAVLLSSALAGEVTGITSSGSTTSAVGYGEPKLTGSISLDLNSNFILYGTTIWDNSDDLDGQITFNPSFSLNYQYSDALSFNGGVWLDWNENGSTDLDIAETDLWVGAAYTSGIATYSVSLQNWQYSGESEEILDVGVSFDTFLNPSILIHNRLGEGASGGDRGTFAVLGLSHGFDLSDKHSITIPVAFGFALTDDFHDETGADTGFGYASIGIQHSYALTDNSSFNLGATYHFTEDDVTRNSSQGGDDDFLTWNVGYSYNF